MPSAGIQHPNIVSIFDVGREQGRPYLVFELVDGKLLSDRLKRATPELHDSLDIFTGMLSGVDQVHQKGIVHRDIKPSNIILNAEGMPRIMDFGIVRILTPGSSNDEVLTGTPRYMAPEYIVRGEVNAQADVFALGAILYELLTGSHAFIGKDQHTLLQNIQERQVPPPWKKSLQNVFQMRERC
ncbi:serine/threonine protein kinase [Candidatus Vondammii sp. HM_W22]|uniref:serine/threonine protein kinase n=1 Tax=Candidatus Vondammii sp. HM_W22 TaxID=2687299 RepID=UPI002E7BBA8B|nr:serine/threonine-protein kinase [Candidatus Vondammii sp. HM_W22]